jgi:hypothetical protein
MECLAVNPASDFASTVISAGENIIGSTKQTDGGTYSIRYAISNVKNVFNNVDVDPALFGAVKRGKDLFVKVRHTGTRTENGVAVHYPIEVGMSFRFPVNVVNAEDLEYVAQELINAVFLPTTSTLGNTTDYTSNLAKLMMGAFPNSR